MPVRLDYQMIEEYVQPGAKVLDLGCGDGTLLAQLIAEKGVAGCGVDIDAAQVRRCISRGVPVYHGDMLEGMAMFEDGRFDCVVLSQTLQQTLEPYTVIREMLRVGRRAIISFPNFGHWRVRFQLLFGGRMPVTTMLLYNWYETPNIRVLTVKDFFALCDELSLEIIDAIYLSARYRRLPGVLANWLAGMAIFVVESRKGA